MRVFGFTLVELLIALAIMAIISAVAMPMYTTYSERTYRGEAGADLLGCGQALERFNSVNFTYQGSADTAATSSPSTSPSCSFTARNRSLAWSTPTMLSTSPRHSGKRV